MRHNPPAMASSSPMSPIRLSRRSSTSCSWPPSMQPLEPASRRWPRRTFPRNDLIATFLTGFKGLNQLATVTPSEYTRLNTAVPPTPQATQQTYGVVADDLAGFPNGRRPGDDTVDIVLRVAMGRALLPGADQRHTHEPGSLPAQRRQYRPGAIYRRSADQRS